MMAETVIMETQTLTFAEGSIYGKTVMMAELSDSNLIAAVGVPAKVTWDGAEYTASGQYIQGAVTLGNLYILDTSFPDTGEPFLICGQVGYFSFVSSDAEATTHSIGITVDIDSTVFEPIFEPVYADGFETEEYMNGMYAKYYDGTIADITQGKTYFVYWDHVFFKVLGESYELELSETESATIQYLGDIGLMAATGEVPEGTDGSGEPFAIVNILSEVTGGTPISVIVTSSSGTGHYVGIFAVATNVVLKDRNGQPTVQAGAHTVRLDTTDGGTKDFVEKDGIPEAIEVATELYLAGGNQFVTPETGKVLSSVEIVKPGTLVSANIVSGVEIAGVWGSYTPPESVAAEVEPDFAEGDMTVTPEAGKNFSEVVIKKPENLISGNIAEGINIAGIIGSFAGGNTGEVKMYSKSFEATAKQMAVEHIAGEVPDILVITIADIPTSGVVFMALGFSQALVEKLGEEYVNEVTFLAAAGGAMRIRSNVGMDMPQTESLYINCGGIRDVTDKKFTIGGSQYGLNVGDYYTYRAICGLV